MKLIYGCCVLFYSYTHSFRLILLCDACSFDLHHNFELCAFGLALFHSSVLYPLFDFNSAKLFDWNIWNTHGCYEFLAIFDCTSQSSRFGSVDAWLNELKIPIDDNVDNNNANDDDDDALHLMPVSFIPKKAIPWEDQTRNNLYCRIAWRSLILSSSHFSFENLCHIPWWS